MPAQGGFPTLGCPVWNLQRLLALVPGTAESPLFPRGDFRRGRLTENPANASSVTRHLRIYSRATSIDEAYTAYSFKRGSLQHQYDQGASVADLQALSGVRSRVIYRYLDPGRHLGAYTQEETKPDPTDDMMLPVGLPPEVFLGPEPGETTDLFERDLRDDPMGTDGPIATLGDEEF
ncbi:MAG: hypothetical protein Pyrs2KO_34370 [Pyruvatibacter sp.]